MIKISHECPVDYMSQFKKYNDYDYCLVHLLEKHPQYASFFYNSKLQNRHVILDNSIFELGESFDWERYLYWIKDISPTEYIIPDVLEDSYHTITQCALWRETLGADVPKEIKTIGVVQGKTYSDLVDCYTYMAENVDKIAISFDYSYYQTIAVGDNKWQAYMKGRQLFIDKLVFDKVWRADKPHHLLGCALPQEFKYYNWRALNIETIDTSNPIQQGFLGMRYDGVNGLNTKNTVKVADTFLNPFEGISASDIERRIAAAEYNVRMFAKICGKINE